MREAYRRASHGSGDELSTPTYSETLVGSNLEEGSNGDYPTHESREWAYSLPKPQGVYKTSDPRFVPETPENIDGMGEPDFIKNVDFCDRRYRPDDSLPQTSRLMYKRENGGENLTRLDEVDALRSLGIHTDPRTMLESVKRQPNGSGTIAKFVCPSTKERLWHTQGEYDTKADLSVRFDRYDYYLPSDGQKTIKGRLITTAWNDHRRRRTKGYDMTFREHGTQTDQEGNWFTFTEACCGRGSLPGAPPSDWFFKKTWTAPE